MSSLMLEPTSTAQWQALVREAEANCSCELGEELESYLVFLLMRFLTRPEMTSSVMALEFLRSQQNSGALKAEGLRDVGDQCLLFSGLFPQCAERRLVKISYFVNIGRSAYSQLSVSLSNSLGALYHELAQGFVPLMDVLQSVREMEANHPALSLLQAAELWQDTGSQKALETLKNRTDATLVTAPAGIKH